MKTILAVTGLPGAGKSMFCEAVQALGYTVFSCGEVVKEETKKRGLPVTASNMAMVSLDIKKREGAAGVSKRLMSKIQTSKSEIVAVDGVRSPDEFELFKTLSKNVIMTAVHAAPKIRFDRIRIRGRQDDTKTLEEFNARDQRELGYGIGNAISLADKMLLNEEGQDEFLDLANKFLHSIIRMVN
ncbi:MAG: AAA family ATPase [archaeon]